MMEITIYDEKNGLRYERQGEYYLPCLTVPPEEEKSVGIWGQRHKRYLKEYHRITYTNLLTSGRLNAYLAEIDEQAKDMLFRLVKEYADREGVAEQLKVENSLEWVGRMNSIKNRVEEVIFHDFIYA